MIRSFAHPMLAAPFLVLALWAGASAADPASAAPAAAGVQTATGGVAETILFYVFGALTLMSALGVALSRSVVRMAVWLFGALAGVAVLYFLLAANFLAAIQLIVYVGGTLVLLIFGVMLTAKSPRARLDTKPSQIWAAWAVCVLLLVALMTVIGRAEWPAQNPEAGGLPVAALGQELLTTYLVPFEVASVLLLVVMIGAAYLARQEK
ncbi:MAG: NADH-quinone oxidoreductase subunit J [Phycisphaerales bacterium]|nr:MAG: NADH-quinone oxidoreductase subunit J [Phycisphaerales bacterium]